MPMKSLKEKNNQIKVYINEASSISGKCKSKLIQLVEKHFSVDLPNDNYLNIDIELLENGNVKMRDVEYTSENPYKTEAELEEKFQTFQKEVDALLNKNASDFDTLTAKKERNNLIWVIFLTFAAAVLTIYSIRELLFGDFLGALWIIIIVGYYIVPATGNSIRNRYVQAYRYLKRLIYKNKK